MTGWGQTGELAQVPGHDINYRRWGFSAAELDALLAANVVAPR